MALQRAGKALFRLYPNPTTGEITVEYEQRGTLQVIDMTGRVMLTQLLPAGGGSAMVYLTNVPAGLYQYRYSVDGTVRAVGKITLVK